MSYFTSTHSFIVIILCFLTGGCSQRALQDARETVHQADSLWHAGQMYDDSAALAQTYETLNAWRYFYADDYAHACYHYGKLLRAKEDPVSAMQAFIHATHSRTRDFHILGRVYSNMGSICHMTEEYSLSYDMYEMSANEYLLNTDTILYYYGLNNMAFELSLLGEKESAYKVLNKIDETKIPAYAKMKLVETKAEACLYKQEYDSALYYSSLFISENEPNMLLIRAQAYSFWGKNDSAVYYANKVLSLSRELYDINNALYILTNYDETKDVVGVRETAGERADMQKIIEIKRSKYAQAAQLLEQDINRKPDFKWLYAIIVTIAFAGAGISTHTYRKRRQHQLLSQKVDDLTQKNAFALQQHEQMVHEHTDYKNMLLSQLEYNCSVFTQSDTFPNNLNWKDFDAMCVVIDNNFNMLVAKLRHEHILSEKEMRLCILVVMNISRPKIAELLPYAASGIGKFKDQTAKKIGTSGKKMRTYLLEMAVGD